MFAMFDLDDTLHDKTAGLSLCAKSVYAKFLQSSQTDMDSFVTAFVIENRLIQPKTDVFSKLAVQFGIDHDLSSAMLDFFYTSFHNYAVSFDLVPESVEWLRASGVKIACVTNGDDFFQRSKISALSLESYFDVIITSGGAGIKKPDPQIFNLALDALGAVASDCVFIGDNLIADMQPAKQLGMKTIWFSSSSTDLPDFVDSRLDSFAHFQQVWTAVVGSKGRSI